MPYHTEFVSRPKDHFKAIKKNTEQKLIIFRRGGGGSMENSPSLSYTNYGKEYFVNW
jgi:hypothetical protein